MGAVGDAAVVAAVVAVVDGDGGGGDGDGNVRATSMLSLLVSNSFCVHPAGFSLCGPVACSQPR